MQTLLQMATIADARELAEMNRMMIDDEGSANPMPVDALEQRMHKWLETKAYEAVLIYRNDEIVGYVLYREERDEYDIDKINIYVRQFFVKRAYRRRGIGKAAFELVAESQFPPDATIILEVLSSNLQGRVFWEHLGFQPYFTVYRRHVTAPAPA